MKLRRDKLADVICGRLDSLDFVIRDQWRRSSPGNHFVVDDLIAGRVDSPDPSSNRDVSSAPGI